jgi:hypothetical protein
MHFGGPNGNRTRVLALRVLLSNFLRIGHWRQFEHKSLPEVNLRVFYTFYSLQYFMLLEQNSITNLSHLSRNF